MKLWMKYIRPYKKYFILGPLCMIVEVIGEVLMPFFLAMIIDNATGRSPIYSVGVAALMIVTAVFMMVGGVGGAYFGAKASVNFASDLREDAYRKVQSFSFGNIDRLSTGSLITRLTNDVTQMQNFVNMLLRMALRSPGMFIGGLIMAISLRPSLAVVLAVTIPLMLISIVGIITKGFSRFSVMQTKVDGLNATVQENLTNVRVVKSFVREGFETKKFHRANKNLKDAGIRAMKIMIYINPIVTLCMNITVVAILWLGGGQVMAGDMSVGTLTAFVNYVNQILMSLMMVTMMLMMSSRALASSRRVAGVITEQPDLNDHAATQKDKIVEQGNIIFKNVSFRYYKDSPDEVLSNIDFTIQGGSTVG
ncbi:MAG: ABC transporter ATP-binding protein, partial [Clostridia bacterium]|nr:ABC transporter ATP-binding protein [Clostridia bacterium]